MRIGRRAVLTAAVTAAVLSGVGAAGALQDGPSGRKASLASGADAAWPAEVADDPTVPTTPEQHDPAAPGSPVPPVDEPAADPPPAGTRLEAELSQEFDSTATGVVTAELVEGSTWEVAVTVEGAVPGIEHWVVVQHRGPDGALSQMSMVCSASSDAAGSLSCSSSVQFEGSTSPAVVSVAGYDPRSYGYRAIGYGQLDAG
jgi:hypothetical protein